MPSNQRPDPKLCDMCQEYEAQFRLTLTKMNGEVLDNGEFCATCVIDVANRANFYIPEMQAKGGGA